MWRVDVTYYQTCGGLMCRDHLRSGFYSKYHPVPVNRIASFLEGVGQSQQIIDPTRQCDIFVRQCYIVVAHSRHRLVLTFLQTTTRETSHKIPRTAIQAEHIQKRRSWPSSLHVLSSACSYFRWRLHWDHPTLLPPSAFHFRLNRCSLDVS